jgi:hypothetical protein
MRHFFWLTLIVLAVGIGFLSDASSIVAPVYHQSLAWDIVTLSIPSLIVAALAIAWRRSAPKSIVLLLISAVLLGAIYFNCQPIFQSPDDLLFPFITLAPMDIMIFLWLILLLIMAHFLEILYREKLAR